MRTRTREAWGEGARRAEVDVVDVRTDGGEQREQLLEETRLPKMEGGREEEEEEEEGG